MESARRAIHLVTHQGEGNQTDRTDCHFGIFVELQKALLSEKQRNPKFEPAHPAMLNPTIDLSPEYGAPRASLIKNSFAADVARAFDGLYSLMLRMLGYTFTPGGDSDLRMAFGQSAIIMMATVLKPLGEGLMQLPATNDTHSPTAGPSFGLTRHVTLPVDAKAAKLLVSERLTELTLEISTLAASPTVPPAIGKVEATLRRISEINRSWFVTSTY